MALSPSIVDSKGVEHLDFAVASRRVKKMSEESLRFTIKDAGEALANSTLMEKKGFSTTKVGFYADEIHVCYAELNRRRSE